MDLLDDTTFEATIKGRVFRLRKMSVTLAWRIHGDKALGMLRGENAARDGSAPQPSADELLEIGERYCRFGMVDPVLGDKTDTGARPAVYSFDDLGDYAWEIVAAIKDSGGDASGFPRSSEAGAG